MASPATIALEAQAVQELRAGHFEAAFRYADRRCRIPPHPEPHCYVLRAEALDRMGRRESALIDLRRALAMAPDDIAANRRMLLWATGKDRVSAALTLTQVDGDYQVHSQALSILRAEGRSTLARVCVSHRRIEGWATWVDGQAIEVRVTDDMSSLAWEITPDPAHVLRGGGSAASFDLPRPLSAHTQTIEVSLNDRPIASVRAAPNGKRAANGPFHHHRTAPRTGATVIVPVYGDYPATRACVESVRRALRVSPGHRLILVDDDAPDPRISAYLASLAGEPRIDVLVNPSNLGFVGSINRALDHARNGDVVLLNADTLVPPSFADDLAAAAGSAPDIGTVTPLSNNGEFTSFPVPNRANPLPSSAEVDALHRLAAHRNRGIVVDLPSGIGFCLYVTRDCLDAVKRLSEDYHRGYLEDADLCLRARECGFRNVCAASVYVGHAGGRSFAQDKRALVVRNLAILERRFPTHRAECAAFMTSDPLRRARESMERDMQPSATRPRLLVTTRPMLDVATERARRLRHAAQAALVVQAGADPAQSCVSVFDPAGHVPQSLRFDLACASEQTDFARYCRLVGASRIEVFDPTALPAALLHVLLGLEEPLDLVAAGPDVMALLCGTGQPVIPARWSSRPLPYGPASDRVIAEPLQALIDKAERVLAPDREAELLLRGSTTGHPIIPLETDRGELRRHTPPTVAPAHLGIVPVTASLREQRVIAEVTRHLRRLRPDLRVTVLGGVADDGRLMGEGEVFVTGHVDAADLDEVMDVHGIRQVMLGLDRPIFGHPLVRRTRRCGLPTAYADWLMGAKPAAAGDLAIDPRQPLPWAAQQLAAWVPR